MKLICLFFILIAAHAAFSAESEAMMNNLMPLLFREWVDKGNANILAIGNKLKAAKNTGVWSDAMVKWALEYSNHTHCFNDIVDKEYGPATVRFMAVQHRYLQYLSRALSFCKNAGNSYEEMYAHIVGEIFKKVFEKIFTIYRYTSTVTHPFTAAEMVRTQTRAFTTAEQSSSNAIKTLLTAWKTKVLTFTPDDATVNQIARKFKDERYFKTRARDLFRSLKRGISESFPDIEFYRNIRDFFGVIEKDFYEVYFNYKYLGIGDEWLLYKTLYITIVEAIDSAVVGLLDEAKKKV